VAARRWFGRWWPVFVYSAGIFVASSLPGSGLPKSQILAQDKLVHAVVFAGLAALAVRAARRPGRSALTAFTIAWAYATGYGAIDELHQRMTPGRFSDVFDLVADAVGAAVGGGVGAKVMAWADVLRQRRAD
jgi:VanZ family protein